VLCRANWETDRGQVGVAGWQLFPSPLIPQLCIFHSKSAAH